MAPRRLLSTGLGPLAPKVIHTTRFPEGVVFHSEKDGAEITAKHRNRYVCLLSKGDILYPESPLVTSRDFKCAQNFFAWLGEDAVVKVDYDAAVADEVRTKGEEFGTWLSESELWLFDVKPRAF